VEGELSVNSGIAPPTSTALDYIYSSYLQGLRSTDPKKSKTKAIVVDEKRRKKTNK
jgi:hypothetical protein